jgi:putative colanic acid biosynthesis acetyltransferase WcaF
VSAELPCILLLEGVKRRRIQGQDLARYRGSVISGNRGPLWRAAWYLVNALLFRSTLLGLLPSAIKARLLRLFGAEVGEGLVCKLRVSIKYPWFLELGHHVWLGEGAWIDNHCAVRIGPNVCVSQEAYLLTGNDDWDEPGFGFYAAPVVVEAGAWIGARAILGPGAVIRQGEVVAAGQLVTRTRPLPGAA